MVNRGPRGRALSRRTELPRLLDALPRGGIAASRSPPPLTLLAELEDLLHDTDAALEAGFRGGHARLVALLTAPIDDEDVVDAVAKCVATATAALPLGWGFPVPAVPDSVHPPPPLCLRFHSFLDAPAVDAPRLRRWWPAAAASDAGPHACPSRSPKAALTAHACGAALADELSVLVRPVPPAIHRQRGQDDVGVALWPAAPVMARWALAHLDLLAAPSSSASPRGGPRVLEIGAGIGLTGTVVGLYAAVGAAAAAADVTDAGGATAIGRALPSMTLTDFNPVVIENLRYNAALNDPCLNAAEMPAAAALLAAHRRAAAPDGAVGDTAAPAPLIAVCQHDWSKLVAALRPPPLTVQLPPQVRQLMLKSVPSSPALLQLRAQTPTSVASSVSLCDMDGSAAATTAAAEAAAFDECIGAGEEASELAPPPLNRAGVDGGRICGGDALPPSAVFDVILGSDMICCVEDAHGVAATLARHLRRPEPSNARGHDDRFAAQGGLALVLVPPPFARYGVDALAPALHAAGMVATVETVHPAFTAPAYPPAAATAAEGGSDASDIVVAGGRERELQLWVIGWPEPRCSS